MTAYILTIDDIIVGIFKKFNDMVIDESYSKNADIVIYNVECGMNINDAYKSITYSGTVNSFINFQSMKNNKETDAMIKDLLYNENSKIVYEPGMYDINDNNVLNSMFNYEPTAKQFSSMFIFNIVLIGENVENKTKTYKCVDVISKFPDMNVRVHRDAIVTIMS